MAKGDLGIPFALSPHFLATDFPIPDRIEDQVLVFADRVRGWQLDIAERIAKTEPHGGFAVLSIVLSYFESIAKFKEGYVGTRQSPLHFDKGARDALGSLIDNGRVSEEQFAILYDEARNGLYHTGMTGLRIVLSGEEVPFNQAPSGYPPLAPIWYLAGYLWINPGVLVQWAQRHFSLYIAALVDDIDLRNKFHARFMVTG